MAGKKPRFPIRECHERRAHPVANASAERVSGTLSDAVARHRAGDLPAAAHIYNAILEREPDNPKRFTCSESCAINKATTPRRSARLGGRLPCSQTTRPSRQHGRGVSRPGQFDRAAAGCCKTALALCPDYPDALCNLGAGMQGMGRRDEAVEYFTRALTLQPDFITVHNNLGIALRDLGKWDEALEHFRRAVELEPNYAPARTNLGLLLLDCGQAEEALKHCQEATRLQPDTAALHHNLGNVLRNLECFVEARSAYLEALRLEPNLTLSAPTWVWSCTNKGSWTMRCRG